MRTLEQALYDHELIVLRTIGEWWEVDLTGVEEKDCVAMLVQKLTNLDLPQELTYLPPEEGAAFQDLIAHHGRIPTAAFVREHGEVRQMGPGRMEREEPWLSPISPAEALWYRGFLYRGFDETAEGMIEFYYLPPELLAQFPGHGSAAKANESPVTSLTPADPPETIHPAGSDAVDDLTTLLALAKTTSLMQSHLNWSDYLLNPDSARRSLLLTLATEMELLRQTDAGLHPTRAAVSWLKQSRESQLRALVDAWSSSAWNELRRTPGIVCEGEGWENDPILARTALLDALPRQNSWFHMDRLIDEIHQTNPDFQRPDGNYDNWYIRELERDNYITGFENWALVEGRLIRFLLQGPLHWLGFVDLGDYCYRLTGRALDWLNNVPPPLDAVRVPLVVQANGMVVVPQNADRYVRFQAARISEPQLLQPGRPYHYRLTPASLTTTRNEGISADRILQFLADASQRPVPAGVKRALARWAERGVEGRLETAVLLRVKDKKILETLRQNPKTRPYIGESLGELAAAVRGDAWEKLAEAAAQLGLLLDLDVKE